ncbi:MAG: uroporphyrinogen-III synthase [Hyphomicrobiaceae bacterium]
MNILLTRPRASARELATQLEALGHRVMIDPLMRVEFLALAAPTLDGIGGLVATSANALRALATPDARVTGLFARALRLPVYVVGPATARAARELGFGEISVGPGTSGELLDMMLRDGVPQTHRPLLHVAGENRAHEIATALTQAGIETRLVVAYRAEPAEALSADTVQAIRSKSLDAVVLMSPRSARIYASLIVAAGLTEAARDLAYFCLSAAVSAALAPIAPRTAAIAPAPETDSLLALIRAGTAKVL